MPSGDIDSLKTSVSANFDEKEAGTLFSSLAFKDSRKPLVGNHQRWGDASNLACQDVMSSSSQNDGPIPGLFGRGIDSELANHISQSFKTRDFRNVKTLNVPVYPEGLLRAIKDNEGYVFKPTKFDPLLQEPEGFESLIPWPALPEYKECIKLYKQQQAAYWTMEEVPMKNDKNDFDNKLSDEGREFILSILGFFVSSDTIVVENLAVNFLREVKRWEPKMFFGAQIFIEGVHSETYTMLMGTFVKSSDELEKRVASIRNYPHIKQKDEWALRWIADQNTSFAERLIAFIVVEGIFFSASFCAIGWLGSMGIMDGLCYSNEKISSDEGLHCKHGIALLKMLKETPPAWRIQEIVASGVEVELNYVKGCLPTKLIGMNAELMCQYVQFVADTILQHMGCQPLYNVKNPFDWMNNWSVDGLASFFEHHNSVYQIANVMTSSSKKPSPVKSPKKVDYDADF